MFSQPLSSPGVNAQAASTVSPLSGQMLVPFASLPSSSLRGLVSVDPFASTRTPLGTPDRLPTRREISGHYPALSTTTSRLTPRRASRRLSPSGYGFSYRLHRRSEQTGPHMDHRPPTGTLAHEELRRTLRGLPGSS